MFELDEADPAAVRVAPMLDKIAAALDCSVSAFSTSKSCEPAETSELLQLWLTITDRQDRAKVLAFVRSATTHKLARSAAE